MYDGDYYAFTYVYKIPKILEREKLFYSNIAQAGLRENGEVKLR